MKKVKHVSNCIYHGCLPETLTYKRDELYAAAINNINNAFEWPSYQQPFGYQGIFLLLFVMAHSTQRGSRPYPY